MAPEEDGCPGEDCINVEIESDKITYDLSGDPSTPPEASIECDSSVVAGEEVECSAPESTHPDGTIDEFVYDFEDGPTETRSYASSTVSYQYDEPGTYEIELTVEDTEGLQDTDSQSITVEEPAPPEPVLDCDSSEVVGEKVECNAPESTHPGGTIDEFVYDFEEGPTEITSYDDAVISHQYEDPGNYEIELTVKDNTYDLKETTTTVVSVSEPAFFETSIDSNSPVKEGETLEVSIEVTNVGGTADSKTITIAPDDSYVFSSESVTLELSEGESTTETIQYETSNGDAGEYSFDVESDDYSDSTSVDVIEPASFTIDTTGYKTVTAGQTLDIAVDVANTGGVEGGQEITLSPEATAPLTTQSKTVTLDANEEKTVVFTLKPDVDTTGEYDIEILSDDDDSEMSVNVVEPTRPEFDIDIPLPDVFKAGEESTIPVTITNPDSLEAELTMLIDGTPVGTKQVTDSTAVQFTHIFQPGASLLEIELADSIGFVSRESWDIDTEGVPPAIPEYSPSNLQQSVSTGRELVFSITPVDPFDQTLETEWYVNGSLVMRGDEEFQRTFDTDGTYEVTAKVINEDNLNVTRTWTVQVDAFTESPNIADHTTADRVTPDGERELVTFSFWNPNINDRTAVVEIRAETPDGFAISGGQGVDELDQAQSTAVSEVEPGEQTNIALNIDLTDESLVGESRTFDYEILYYPENATDEAIIYNESTVTVEITSDTGISSSDDSENGDDDGQVNDGTDSSDDNIDDGPPDDGGPPGPIWENFDLIVGVVVVSSLVFFSLNRIVNNI